MTTRLINPADEFRGQSTLLRLLTLDDVTDRYVAWLNDPQVNRYLETRFRAQTSETVREFVAGMVASSDSYLFGIIALDDRAHVGNLKIGPINRHHEFADVSYFIGDRSRWGKGLATDAIRLSVEVAFSRLKLHRVQAGVYEHNVGSCRALERAGFALEGRFSRQLRNVDGNWEDHVWYGRVRD